MASKLPSDFGELTPGWFERALSRAGEQLRITHMEAEAIGAGAGLMSSMHRVRFTYAEGNGPASVIVKQPTANAQNREVGVTFDNYQREIAFYRHGATASPLRTPHAFVAESDAPDRMVLVMEDLGAWSQGSQVEGCALDRAEAVMDALGKHHARFWDQVDDGAMDWLPNGHPSVMSAGLASGTATSWDNFADFFADDLTPELIQARDHYLQGLPAVQRWMNDAPRTIVHGDFRMDNLFFRKTSDPTARLEVACCDWQAPVRGKGIQDIAYFLSGSVDTSVRRAHEQALLARWVAALEAGGVQDYTLEQALDGYRRAILMLWTFVVVIGGGMASVNDRGESWISAMVKRSAAAMTDHNCLVLLAGSRP